jgi:hypothetical protein
MLRNKIACSAICIDADDDSNNQQVHVISNDKQDILRAGDWVKSEWMFNSPPRKIIRVYKHGRSNCVELVGREGTGYLIADFKKVIASDDPKLELPSIPEKIVTELMDTKKGLKDILVFYTFGGHSIKANAIRHNVFKPLVTETNTIIIS